MCHVETQVTCYLSVRNENNESRLRNVELNKQINKSIVEENNYNLPEQVHRGRFVVTCDRNGQIQAESLARVATGVLFYESTKSLDHPKVIQKYGSTLKMLIWCLDGNFTKLLN